MRDYEILRKALMDAWRGQYCSDCELNSLCQDDDSNCWFKQAAAAIEELLDELTTIRKQLPHWISVEERLPEDFQKVLVFWWEHSEPMVDTAFWQKDAKRFDGEHWVRMEDKVTHWMPLPAPPKEVE